jgi:hypothetical protein
MAGFSFLGPNCDCDCDPAPPVTDYFRYRAGSAIIAKGGVPAFRPHSRGLKVTRIQQHLSDVGPFRSETALVVNDGVNNGCWESFGGAWVRKAGYENPAGVTSTAFWTNIDGAVWFAEGDTFATMVFDNGALMPARPDAWSGGDYDAMFARSCWAWQCSDVGGTTRWEMNREPLMETYAASRVFLSYMQAYGFLKGTGVREFDGAIPGNLFEAAVDGAETRPTARLVPLFGWVPGGANTAEGNVRYRAGIGFVPVSFVPGDFCREVVGDDFNASLDFVCIAAVNTSTGSGVGGSALRPSQDETHWKRAANRRGMPWDARPAAYESDGSFTVKVVPKKRYRNVTERTHVALVDSLGAVLDSTDGSRTWEFSRFNGGDRDHWSYRQTSYTPCRNLYAGEVSASRRIQGALVEFPALPIEGSSPHTLVASSANEARWEITIQTGFITAGTKLVITQTVDLADEITNAEIEEEVIRRANALYASIVGYGTQQERRWSDGSAYYGPGPDGSPAGGGVPPAPARPFMPYQVTFLSRPFAGEFNDSYFLAQHYRVEACKQAYHMPADETQCLSLAEGEYISGVRTGTWYKFDCGRVGELVFERAPDPGNIRAYDYGEGFAPCPP